MSLRKYQTYKNDQEITKYEMRIIRELVLVTKCAAGRLIQPSYITNFQIFVWNRSNVNTLKQTILRAN